MDEFQFTFSDKVAIERRVSSLENKIDLLNNRIAKYSKGCNPRPWKLQAIERFQDRIIGYQDELDILNDELTNYVYVKPQTEDAWSVTVRSKELSDGTPFGMAKLSIVDSIFDDTYVEGDNLKVRTTATKRKSNGAYKSWGSNFTVVDGVTDDGITTFNFGSSSLGTMLDKYDTVTVSVFNEFGDTIFSQVV
jgi:hypothetical protein|tara:strand:+ start:1038 stop:1613 length:576 start_codon:yes stop_codon:yes gene_type:complete